MTNRLKKLDNLFEKNSIDAFAIVPGSNFRYLTGGNFHLMERPTVLIIKKNHRPVAILPSLEIDSFNALSLDAEIISWHDKDGYIDAFKKASQILGPLKNIGVEGQRIRFFESLALQESFKDCKIVNAHSLISTVRLNKDSDEIKNIEKAISISEIALSNTIKYVSHGKSELEIKNFLIQELYKNGAEGIAFDPIVLGSKNSALPHGHSTDYILEKGDALLFDFGASINGYNADITRTFFIDNASDYQRNYYNTVLKANNAGIDKSRINITLDEVDDTVLKILEESEYKDFVVHKTGHGLGLDVHEDPYVVRGNKNVLTEGMVITIEPGLYNPDSLGVRIEDDVLITETEPKILTKFSKELIII